MAKGATPLKPRIAVLVILSVIFPAAFAQVPLSAESFQLQKLINVSEQQLKSAKELLDANKRDAESLDKAARVLEQLSSGINRSIQEYQGTEVYNQALLKLQTDSLGKQIPEKGRLERFQKESVAANLADLEAQQKLAEGLRSAEHGFVPKLQTQAQIGNWRASTRVSAQLTELLTAVQGLKEGGSAKEPTSGLATLLQGSEILNQKQREVVNHGPR